MKKHAIFSMPSYLYSRAFLSLFPCLCGTAGGVRMSWMNTPAQPGTASAAPVVPRRVTVRAWCLVLRLGKSAAGGGFGKVPLLAGAGRVATVNMHKVALIYAPVRNDAKRLEVVKGNFEFLPKSI